MANKPKLKRKPSTAGSAGSGSRGSDHRAPGNAAGLLETAQQVWMAGLGALQRAQAEGGKLFETLVREGGSIESRTRQFATGKVDSARDAVETTVTQVRERAADTWEKLEKVFEDRVSRALAKLGVPGRDEMQALIDRVDELNRTVRRMNASEGGSATGARRGAAKSTGRSRRKGGTAGVDSSEG